MTIPPRKKPDEPFLELLLRDTEVNGLLDLLQSGIDLSDQQLDYFKGNKRAETDLPSIRALKEVYQGILKQMLDTYDTFGRDVKRGTGRRMRTYDKGGYD